MHGSAGPKLALLESSSICTENKEWSILIASVVNIVFMIHIEFRTIQWYHIKWYNCLPEYISTPPLKAAPPIPCKWWTKGWKTVFNGVCSGVEKKDGISPGLDGDTFREQHWDFLLFICGLWNSQLISLPATGAVPKITLLLLLSYYCLYLYYFKST